MNITNYIHYKEKDAKEHIKLLIKHYLKNYNPDEHNFIIFFCIGSDRITGDALGPFVGYFLQELERKENIRVIGTLNYPVHGNNVISMMEYVNETFINPFVIAIDSSFGKNDEQEGWIWVSDGDLSPGSGLSKEIESIGNISISGCTASLEDEDQTLRFLVMQGVRLNMVVEMAELIANSIKEVMVKKKII